MLIVLEKRHKFRQVVTINQFQLNYLKNHLKERILNYTNCLQREQITVQSYLLKTVE